MAIRSGELRHAGLVQQSTETQNASGEPIAAWTTHHRGQFGLDPLSGREMETSRQTYGQVSHRATGRWRSGVTPKMRLIIGSVDSNGDPVGNARTFQVEAALNVEERGREMHLFVTEHV